MPQKYLRKYNEATTIDFVLFEPDGVDIEDAASFASGDLKIMKDEAAEANTSNLPTDEGQGYSLALTATEMQAARIVIYIVDQTASKVWLDEYLIIETYGDTGAQHDFNAALNDLADVFWDEVMESGAPANAQTARQWMRLMAAALFGITAGSGDWSAQDIAETKTRISGTLDSNGARTAIGTLDGS